MTMKTDNRAARYAWAPGKYLCRCSVCKDYYAGEKRSTLCADCAYALPEPPPPISELNNKPALVVYFEDELSRDEFIEAFKAVKPNCRTIKV